MIDPRIFFNPVYKLYVPSGWTIHKNHLFEINKEVFSSIEDENNRFLIEEYFIDDGVFWAQCDLPLNTVETISATIDVGCNLIDREQFILKYDINLYISKKNKDILLEMSEFSNDVNNVEEVVSRFMMGFSHEQFIDFKSGEIKKISK